MSSCGEGKTSDEGRHKSAARRIGWSTGGMRVSGCGCAKGRQLAGMLLVIAGVLIVFLCLPMQFFLIALGVVLTAAGLLLLR